MAIIRSKNNNLGGPVYYLVPGSSHVNTQDIWWLIRDGHNPEFDNCDEYKVLKASLMQAEYRWPSKGNNIPDLKGDTGFLNRVIRSGGIITYIKAMEMVLCKKNTKDPQRMTDIEQKCGEFYSS